MSTLYADPAVLWQRVLERVTVNREGCWIFPGATNSRGYGLLCSGRKGKSVLTHRLAVIVRDGSIPEGLTVDHQCHDSRFCNGGMDGCSHRRCVNPAHLAVMTAAANTRRRYTPMLPAAPFPAAGTTEGRVEHLPAAPRPSVTSGGAS